MNIAFLLGFLACGSKATDSSDTGASTIPNEPSSSQPSTEPTQPASEPSSSQPSSEDTGLPTDTGNPPDDTGDLEDTGTNEVNNSSTPPTGECTENTVRANIDSVYSEEQFFPSFYWDMTTDENGLVVVFAGYKAAASVDVCATLGTEPPPHPQVVVLSRPTLSLLPNLEMSVGLWGIDENVSAQGFMGDPNLQRKFLVTEGSITINSIIEGEKGELEALNLAQLGEEQTDGDWENLTEIPGYVQSDTGIPVVACYCPSMADFYIQMMNNQ